ncbi:hypothetical protein RFI36_00265 [Acinetobacter gerneri]|uniref:C2H2-type domain-containing protein n=1 Tax=Acinetobacter gerneri TaxID=202952 RepID=A0AAW8JH15_9GAMM|nr:hypothetical protein [Acinetobacter gerneri]MDQ9008179.1 hypothetical protein [Acinetobacter gerneri]MDQ9012407.1 hypothetical protein [Acinetobacter gerneri]MDQ9023718.1 hypothetical protein [Acinetobacter gerneri]MDQ9051320.1 hypothetical protein [Acinetobacter gerneri]MDQ9058821.1 hypothetical protein [Acinetobacter gerneri]
MILRYHCACCEHVLTNAHKECPHCGSHHIRSPISMWIFCVVASLVVVVTLSLIHAYIKNHEDTPRQQSLLEFLNRDKAIQNHDSN